MPKLSVVIPVHNEEKRLPRCLRSILAQSFADWEVVCVDDGSRDGTADVLQKFVDDDKRIRGSAFTRHLGTVLARKLALLDAKGDYVMFADADDEFLPGAFANAANASSTLTFRSCSTVMASAWERRQGTRTHVGQTRILSSCMILRVSFTIFISSSQ